uniref:Uncharacterized protein n=1 Tax=Arundo donax TaxID=35708 RepID=A0A0A9FKC7_ARUDO
MLICTGHGSCMYNLKVKNSPHAKLKKTCTNHCYETDLATIYI